MSQELAHISKAQVRYIRSLQQKKIRDAEGVFVAEGDKCIGELMGAFELVLLANRENATQSEIEQMSSLRTPQGSIAVFKKRTDEASTIPSSSLEGRAGGVILLALDGIQDPGNLGTIIRTCDWFGVRDIYCSRETADCYNPKVVQATMGALARVRIHYVDLCEWLESKGGQGGPAYGTLLDGRNIYEPAAIPDKTRGIIIMGNEGNGISPEVRPYITHPLYIPSYANGGVESLNSSTVESLNVSIATAITLAEFRRI